MVELHPSPTELTTAATDLLLALYCAWASCRLAAYRGPARFRALIWTTVFGLIGLASLLGTVAHGLVLPPWLYDALWHPLYLALGLAVALILVGAIHDGRGERAARRAMVPALAIGALAYGATQALGGAFIVFIVYEGVATLAALAIYLLLAARSRLPGAAAIATGLVLNLAAAGVQASDLALVLLWPFDHNGLFHLVLLAALVCLYLGLRRGFRDSWDNGSGGV